MSEENLKAHVDDIINALKGETKEEISPEELEQELIKFMEYGVPIEQAKQSLIKKFGGTAVLTDSSSTSERILISDLKPNQSSVKLLGHVIAINPKEITVKGETKKIFYGIIGDESGTIPFTSWKEISIEKGDVVEVSNAYTREWLGAVQLNFGDRVIVEKTDRERLPKTAFEPKELKLKDFKSGIGRVDVTARILEINSREVEVNGETKKVFSGIIGDETGKAQFTSWHDFKIKEGDVLRINGGYIKSWKGIPQLTFDSNATVKKLEKSKIGKEEFKSDIIPIHTLIEKRGALDIEVEGTIIDIKPGSGFITRCPECNRVLMNGLCAIHEKVDGIPDLRIKIIVDDGTGAVGSSLNKELSEKLLDITLDDAKNMNEETLMQEINEKLFAKKIRLKGNALSDDFGTNIIAKDVDIQDINIEEEAEKLSNELEELQ